MQVGSHTTTATSFSSERRKEFGLPSPNDGPHEVPYPSPATAASQPASVTKDPSSLEEEEDVKDETKTIFPTTRKPSTSNVQRGHTTGSGFAVPKRGTKIKFLRKNVVSAPNPPPRPEERIKQQQQQQAPIHVGPEVEPDVTHVWPHHIFQPIPQPGNFRLREINGFHSVKYITGGAWRKNYYKVQEAREEAKAKGLAPPLKRPGPPENDDNIYFDFPCGLGFHFAKNIDTDNIPVARNRRPIYANHFGALYLDQREEYRLTSVEQWQRTHPVKPFLPLDPDLGRTSMPIRFRLTEDENPYERAPLVLNRHEIVVDDGDYTFI